MAEVSPFCLKQCGIQTEDHVLVALSGGADSTALLLMMKDMKDAGHISQISAAHFNHMLRGAEADRDEQFCEELCRKNGIAFYFTKEDVKSFAEKEGLSLETAARNLRYAYLVKVKNEIKADHIAVAHHREDQAETVLMHLLRGSGLNGLCGMKPEAEGIVRPLLGISKEELLSYLSGRNQGYCTDSTNKDTDYTRNRIRNELIPELEKYQPDVVNKLSELSQKLAADEEYLSELAGEQEKRITKDGGLARKELEALPEPLRRRVILQKLRVLQNYDVKETDVLQVEELIPMTSGKMVSLPQGLSAWNDGEILRIGKRSKPESKELVLETGNEMQFGGFLVKAEKVKEYIQPENAMNACIALDGMSGELKLRLKQDGDRFQPFGMTGSKLVSDIFIDRKTPEEMRNVPMVCCGDEIIFIPGYTISEKVKVNRDSKDILYISTQREQKK